MVAREPGGQGSGDGGQSVGPADTTSGGGELRERVGRELPGWRVDGEELLAEWRLPDFAAALAAAVRVGALAERADHHPDLALGWGKLQVRLTTHSAHALTAKDVELAVKIHAALGAPGQR